MFKKRALIILLMTSLFVGCSDGGHSRGAILVSGTPGGNSSLPPPPVAPNYHYLGLLWGALVGQVYIEKTNQCAGTLLSVAGNCLGNVTLDGQATNKESMKTGQIIELRTGGGSASIDIRRTVVGPVDAVDAAHSTLTVLGQRVYVTNQTQGGRDTTLAGQSDFTGVAVGDWISVSGHFSATGQVVATLIDRNALAGPMVLRGILLEKPNGLFGIGDMLIDLSAANLEGFPGGAPLSGDAVLLFADRIAPDNVLSVQTAHYAGGIWDPAGYGLFEYNGFITGSRGAFDFDISGYRLYYSTWDCQACNDLNDSSKSPALGTPVVFFNDSTGNTHLNLNAFDVGGTVLTGPIDSIDATGSSFSVSGFKVTTTPATHISADKNPWVGSDTLDIAALTVGKTVTVYGGVRFVPDDSLLAASVAPDGEGVHILTQIYDRADPEIFFLGQSILTDEGTTLTACDYEGVCNSASPSWLFENTDYFRPQLTIDIDPDVVPLRAANIRAVRDN